MASSSNESSKIYETHGKTTMVHEIKVDGYHLVERKQKTLINPCTDLCKTTISIHSRSIDDRTYTVQETLTESKDVLDRVIETQMTQEQVETFEEDWSNLWNPEMNPDLTENL